ncbi:uncharacterized protein LOC116376711 [Oncorhynchus kisutch]|uniref:uncharacterized protein LOC116376711 n=1 Tax=Oncorhynchus kisutch TaxID=8019 RepID=UPI0012DF071F|nr:uncharacterized protein LOC116376711 [Oncorhynchus kisutch]
MTSCPSKGKKRKAQEELGTAQLEEEDAGTSKEAGEEGDSDSDDVDDSSDSDDERFVSSEDQCEVLEWFSSRGTTTILKSSRAKELKRPQEVLHFKELKSIYKAAGVGKGKREVKYVVAKKGSGTKRVRRLCGVKGKFKVVDGRMQRKDQRERGGKKVKETEVARVRALQCVSYLEVLRRVEGASGAEEVMVVELTSVNVSPQPRDGHKLHSKNGEEIRENCSRALFGTEFTAEALQEIMSKDVPPSQAR